jgi:hypothetical protein
MRGSHGIPLFIMLLSQRFDCFLVLGILAELTADSLLSAEFCLPFCTLLSTFLCLALPPRTLICCLCPF